MPPDVDEVRSAKGPDELSDTLNSLCRDPSIRTLYESSLSLDPRIAAPASVQLHRIGDALLKLIEADERFCGSQIKMIRNEQGASGFYPIFAGNLLLQKALEHGNAANAISWLRHVVSLTSAVGTSITALWGVAVARRVDLTDNISIVPIEDLPDSEQKRWALNLGHFRADTATFSGLDSAGPTFALTKSVLIAPQ